jgi:hypothetical protein
MGSVRAVAIDVARSGVDLSSKTAGTVTLFGCIEDMKNGTLNVHKYNSVAMVVRPATVLIVTNQLGIDRSLLVTGPLGNLDDWR